MSSNIVADVCIITSLYQVNVTLKIRSTQIAIGCVARKLLLLELLANRLAYREAAKIRRW